MGSSIVALLPFFSAVAGCPYAGSGKALPVGHPPCSTSEDEVHAPSWRPEDVGGGSFFVPGGGISRKFLGKSLIDLMAFRAKVHGSPLCYWSWQSLPPPPLDGDWATPYDFAALNAEFAGDSVTIRDLAGNATLRLQAHIDAANRNSTVVGGFCTQGYDHATYLCDRGLYDAARCVGSVVNESMVRWPTSINMFLLDGTPERTADLTSVIEAWRSLPSEHEATINDAIIATERGDQGWGTGGGLVAKLFECEAIPSEFTWQTGVPQDAPGLVPKMLDFWVRTKGVELEVMPGPGPSPAPAPLAVEA